MARRAAAIAALVLVAFVGAASARALNDEAAFGRGLLQTLDCTRVHKACSTCRNQRIAGTKTTELVCSTCAPGWRLRADGASKTCDCAPGFATNATEITAANAWCKACPQGKYCLGGSAANTNSDSATCPSGLLTIFAGAKSQAQCFTVAGYGRKASTTGNGEVVLSASLCPKGTFNVGKNTAGCQKCPAGLTTVAAGATASSLCVAPAGSYVDRGIGRLCPKGTYTTDFNKAIACTPCPTGVTTANEGSSSAAACALATKGYYLTSTSPAAAAKCPVNTYNDQEAAITVCPTCPNGWRTQDIGATGQAFCLAPPGYELKAGASAITPCDNGLYKPDWNRNPCVACGDNLITEGTGSVAKDDCLVPVGYGLESLNPLKAQLCQLNSYGAEVVRPALAGARCTACQPNTFTLDALAQKYPSAGLNAVANYTSETDCVVQPGWGATETLVEVCKKGTYSTGFVRAPCAKCPAGYTTLAEGATSLNDCVIQPGWEFDQAKQLPRPCDKGSYSLGGNAQNPNGQCVACATGYSTQEPASDSADDCNVCAAGHGGNSCAMCTYDTFAEGGAKVGEPCRPCASGSVAGRNSSNSEECYPALVDVVGDTFVLSDETAWTNDASTDAVACAAACTADATCATYRFNTASNKCQLLKEDSSASATLLGFKLADGADYALYNVASGLTATTVVDTAAGVDLAACTKKCTDNNKCEAIAFPSLTGTGSCQLLASQLSADTIGMVHVVGAKLYWDRQL